MNNHFCFVYSANSTQFLSSSYRNQLNQSLLLTNRPFHTFMHAHKKNRRSQLKFDYVISCAATTNTTTQLLTKIQSIAGDERGLFGLEDPERAELNALIEAVESQNQCLSPTDDNAKVTEGKWRLLYTNLQILGRKRVRLAIRTSTKPGFVKLGDFFQVIDPLTQTTKNIVEFEVLTGGSGTYTITADYFPVNATRVDVKTTNDVLEPEALERLLGENRSLLLKIFNPNGYLNITYVDDKLRIGRDNKGLVFVLEKC